MLKILFHFYNLLLIILYIYPGSILGFLVYKDLSRQPQITSDFFSISSNHLYVFIILSLLGLLSIKKNIVFELNSLKFNNNSLIESTTLEISLIPSINSYIERTTIITSAALIFSKCLGE